jgi:predicted dehydrogenase
MKNFNWAILGPGRIAHRFAEAIEATDNTSIALVHGRDIVRAEAFATKWSRQDNVVRATTNIDDVLNATDIDAVYIATPHSFHADAVRQCLLAKKPVLCEKPMVTDAHTARELIELARSQNTFLMEAVWTRFLPIYAVIAGWLREGAIGRVQAMQSSFCFNAPYDPTSRVYDPAQAGGALLDIGIYNITVTRWVIEQLDGACSDMAKFDARAAIGATGVDHRLACTITLLNDVTSQFICSVESAGENTFHIIGELGTIKIHKYFSAADTATLTRTGEDAITINRPWRVNGFEGEIEEVMRCVAAGKIESDVMPHKETEQTLVWMDEIRRIVGVRYPFDWGG